jgi:hypothetical protein
MLHLNDKKNIYIDNEKEKMMKRNNFGFKKYQKPPHLSNL